MANPMIPRRRLLLGASAGLVGLSVPKLVRASYAPAASQTTRVVNAVVDFGADNTGATNCSVALNNAVAAAVAKGRPLYIPGGTYQVGANPINVLGACDIRGAGASKTILTRNADAILPVLYLQASDISVRGIGFTYTGPNPTVSSFASPLNAYGAAGAVKRIRLEDLSCSGGFYAGFVFDNVTDGWMERCYAEGCVDRGFYVYLACNSIRINNCTAEGLTGSVTGYVPAHNGFYGFNMNPGGTTTLTDITISNCMARNVSAHGFASSERVYNSKIIGCQAANIVSYLGDHSAPAFLVQLANGFAGERTTFTNCAAISCDIGFEVTQSSLVTIEGCRANDSNTKGAWIVNSQDCQITGCQFESGHSGNSAAIYLQTASNTVITGSTMKGHLYGIFEDVGSDRNIISNNVALLNSSAQIARNGTNQAGGNNITT